MMVGERALLSWPEFFLFVGVRYGYSTANLVQGQYGGAQKSGRVRGR